MPILSSFTYLNLLSVRNFHWLQECSYNRTRSFVGKVLSQTSSLRIIKAPGCISSVICMKILHCSPLLHRLLQHVLGQQRVFRHFSKRPIDGDRSGTTGITFSWWSDSALCNISSQWDSVFLVSSRSSISTSVARRIFPAFYSSVCLADRCGWLQVIWRLFSISWAFSVELVVEAIQHFTSTSAQFARPARCPGPEAGVIMEQLCGELLQRSGKRQI